MKFKSKQFISRFIAMVLFVCMFMGSAFATVSGYIVQEIIVNATVYDDFEYEVKNDNTVKITGYTGTGGAVTIPDTINGNDVTSIGYWAFYNHGNQFSKIINNEMVILTTITTNNYFNNANFVTKIILLCSE